MNHSRETVMWRSDLRSPARVAKGTTVSLAWLADYNSETGYKDVSVAVPVFCQARGIIAEQQAGLKDQS